MRCKQCRVLLPGYIQRELAPQQRAQVSRHLNVCADCYAVYMDQRQLVRELSINVPRIGIDTSPHLERIKLAVMADLVRPQKPPVRTYQQARYSLAALLLVIALLVPLTMRSHSFELPTPPRPAMLTPEGTAVAAIFATETATLTATIQTNYAPVSGSTDTP